MRAEEICAVTRAAALAALPQANQAADQEWSRVRMLPVKTGLIVTLRASRFERGWFERADETMLWLATSDSGLVVRPIARADVREEIIYRVP